MISTLCPSWANNARNALCFVISAVAAKLGSICCLGGLFKPVWLSTLSNAPYGPVKADGAVSWNAYLSVDGWRKAVIPPCSIA